MFFTTSHCALLLETNFVSRVSKQQQSFAYLLLQKYIAMEWKTILPEGGDGITCSKGNNMDDEKLESRLVTMSIDIC